MADAFDYAEARDDADELITEFGQAISLRRLVASGSVQEPTLTPVDYATKAVKLDFTLRQIQAGNVLDTDERWIVAAGPLTAAGVTSLATPDVIVVGTDVKPILVARPLAPSGVVVLYDCQIRF